jgi:hypothetical protein
MNNIGRFETEIEANGAALLRQQYRDEIERAVRNAKRTAWDKSFRRQWYRAAAQRERPYHRQSSPWHRPTASGASEHGGCEDEQ